MSLKLYGYFSILLRVVISLQLPSISDNDGNKSTTTPGLIIVISRPRDKILATRQFLIQVELNLLGGGPVREACKAEDANVQIMFNPDAYRNWSILSVFTRTFSTKFGISNERYTEGLSILSTDA